MKPSNNATKSNEWVSVLAHTEGILTEDEAGKATSNFSIKNVTVQRESKGLDG